MWKQKLPFAFIALLFGLFLVTCDGGGDVGDNSTTPNVYYDTLNYGGIAYKTVKIGNRTWMAENLNYKIDSSWCYDNDESKCYRYGRWYTWNAAKNACPSGWHLPYRQEWADLAIAAGGTGEYGNEGSAGTKLKTKNEWAENSGTDDFGFSALPGGFSNNGENVSLYLFGFWWTATEYDSKKAYARKMGAQDKYVAENDMEKDYGLSVRCVQD
jgi:uncharacterized protein (TIGR02145 family)